MEWRQKWCATKKNRLGLDHISCVPTNWNDAQSISKNHCCLNNFEYHERQKKNMKKKKSKALKVISSMKNNRYNVNSKVRAPSHKFQNGLLLENWHLNHKLRNKRERERKKKKVSRKGYKLWNVNMQFVTFTWCILFCSFYARFTWMARWCMCVCVYTQNSI